MLTNIHDLINLYNNQDEFRAHVEYTASQHAFRDELIEKDFLCSLVLKYLYQFENMPLVFKGGTLLTKVHSGFYRLSEDLDFSISIPSTANRKQRSDAIKPIKNIISEIPQAINLFEFEAPLSGRNESKQYNATLVYHSKLNNMSGRILIEIGLREPHLENAIQSDASTLLMNPITLTPIVSPFPVSCYSKDEAYAEKIRAALARKKPAIRDFYDLEHGLNNNLMDLTNPRFIALVKEKLSQPDTHDVDLSENKVNLLASSIDSNLIPTLNMQTNVNFDLMTPINLLRDFVSLHKLT